MTTEREIDQLLVERVQRGDKKAFELLVSKYQRKLMRLVSRLVYDHAEAEDVVQDAFIKVFLHIDDYRRELPFDAPQSFGIVGLLSRQIAPGREVLTAPQQDAFGRFAVAPGATALLLIVFD